MSCSACGAEIELDAAFCGVCGSRLRVRRTTITGSVLAGAYQIESKIAEGGFGSIYKATHVESGLDCALKVLHADLAADPSLAARFRREGATLSRLHDPHTVATYDVGEADDGTLYIAMELLDGESLHDRMAALGVLPWRTAFAIVRDVCSALAEAHELAIVHRDLKPANIHLVSGGSVKLLDFGIAKVAGSEVDDGAELTRMGQTIGTLEYMAPEQIIGGSCEPRSDIYQLGVLMFEMITGRRPFADSPEPTAMITALLTQSAPPPSSVFAGLLPTEVDVLIQRCLEREPEHRFSNVRALDAAIVKALGTADPMLVPTSTLGDDATWIGNLAIVPANYGQTSIMVAAQPASEAMPVFDVPARGSVTEGFPLEATGNVAAISAYTVEPMAVDPFVRTAPAEVVVESRPAPVAAPAPLGFGWRLALWVAALATAGAGIGAAVAALAR